MTEPRLNFTDCPDANGGHRMAWWEWGNPEAAHVIVCAHGLSRQGRDFDVLAQALGQRGGASVRVVCPDVVGRGKSDWLKDPMGYQIPNYAADILAMLAQLKPSKLDWIGTSMGGLIGVVVAGQPGLPLPAPIQRLVLNDVGPVIQWEALQRIGLYLGNAPRFASLEQAATAMWAISTSFGPHTKEQWLELCQQGEHVCRVSGNLVAHRVFEPVAFAPADHVRANDAHRVAGFFGPRAQGQGQHVKIPPLTRQAMHANDHVASLRVAPLPVRHTMRHKMRRGLVAVGIWAENVVQRRL